MSFHGNDTTQTHDMHPLSLVISASADVQTSVAPFTNMV